MTAEMAVAAGFGAAVLAAVALVLVASSMLRDGRTTRGLIIGLVVAGTAYSATVVLLTAMCLARALWPKTPAAFLALVPWALGAAALTKVLQERLEPFRVLLGLALLAVLPAALIAVPAGAIGGAMRGLRDCQGSMGAVASALRQYGAKEGQWPSRAKWMDQMRAVLPYPSAYRCPERPDRAYEYLPPTPTTPRGGIVVECIHEFVGRRVVLRKDLTVGVEALQRPGPARAPAPGPPAREQPAGAGSPTR